jgi:hypothetical protein
VVVRSAVPLASVSRASTISPLRFSITVGGDKNYDTADFVGARPGGMVLCIDGNGIQSDSHPKNPRGNRKHPEIRSQNGVFQQPASGP